MNELIATLAAAALLALAFAVLALTQEPHRQRVARTPLRMDRARIARLRGLAWLGLGAGLLLCIAGHGAAFGSVMWVLLLAAAGVAVAFTLAWRPGALAWLTSWLAT